MSTLFNNSTSKKTQGKLPLWVLAIFSATLFFALSSIGIYAYQKKAGAPQNSVQLAQFELQKQQILEQSDVIDTNWLHTLNPLVKNVRGRLLWSSNKQQGMMEFSSLPKLAKSQQYQLWIYDLNAKESKPVSAIFNNKDKQHHKNKTILIPFTPASLVNNPYKFELLLTEEGKNEDQALLLAQP